jgi:hypothetical protein
MSDGEDDYAADAEFGDDDIDEAPAADDDDDDDEGDGGDDASTAASVTSAAVESAARVDPILRISNRHRTVRIVAPDERVTDNRLQQTEVAYILAMRAEQIARHATCFVPTTSHSAIELAYRELYERRCPLLLRRQVGATVGGDLIVEEWNVREMALPLVELPDAKK